MSSSGSVRIVVSGASGRMGRAIARIAQEIDDVEIVGGIARHTYGTPQAAELGYEVIQAVEEAAWLLERADVIIDFSRPDHLTHLIERHGEAIPALVVGTTGLGEEAERLLDRAMEDIPILVAANFSLGVALAAALAEQAAAALPDYDVEIVEAHHRRKADAPSGTALRLGEAVAAGRGVQLARVRRDGRSGETGERPGGEIAFHALRGGDIVGEHRVLLIGERERIEIAHVAADRGLFADGAVRAAQWIRGRPAGRYRMRDLLEGA